MHNGLPAEPRMKADVLDRDTPPRSTKHTQGTSEDILQEMLQPSNNEYRKKTIRTGSIRAQRAEDGAPDCTRVSSYMLRHDGTVTMEPLRLSEGS